MLLGKLNFTCFRSSFQCKNTIDKGTVDLIYDYPRVAYRISELSDEPITSKKRKKKDAYINSWYEALKKDENISRKKEETRILYVAMTRARRKLICMVPEKKKPGAVTWGTLIGEGKA